MTSPTPLPLQNFNNFPTPAATNALNAPKPAANIHPRVIMDQDMREIIHFSQYAESIYGLPLHMITNWTNFTRTLQHLCVPRSCFSFSSSASAPPLSVAENVRNHLGKPGWPFCCVAEHAPRERHKDLLAISLENGLFRSPYMVCLDHEFHKVVVAVRGTMSTADVLVDLNCDVTPLTLPTTPPLHTKTHSGMLQTAHYIHQDITGLLESLLLHPSSEYKHYHLLVCGHSLGAGVAALLTHLIKSTTPGLAAGRVKCVAYSPPGCVATRESNRAYFEEFVTSVVLGDDAVPRLSRGAVERLQKGVRE
ncbi:hypothetical protein HDU98_003097, partial [Podochytrium sp. JEL0797]